MECGKNSAQQETTDFLCQDPSQMLTNSHRPDADWLNAVLAIVNSATCRIAVMGRSLNCTTSPWFRPRESDGFVESDLIDRFVQHTRSDEVQSNILDHLVQSRVKGHLFPSDKYRQV